MTIRTIVAYLFGSRAAIREIAACRNAVWLGFLFVLSAGFAREYDGEDLLHEPWHLGIPLVASLGTSFLLYCLLPTRGNAELAPEFSFWRGYRSFLSLYWMTAPLAWLYAIPVERLLSAGEATRANLWLLGIVAAWRVILMIRVVSVLFNVKFRHALFPVMLFADTVALVLLFLTPLPVVSIMGGIRLTESEQLIQATVFRVGFTGVLTWPVWLIGMVAVRSSATGPWIPGFGASYDRRIALSAWGLAVCALVVWIPILPVTQTEQQLRWRVESDLRAGRIDSALDTMSSHSRSDFPAHWEPPPRVGYGEKKPSLVSVLTVVYFREPDWVRAAYFEKLNQHEGGWAWLWLSADDEDVDRLLDFLERLPSDSPVLRSIRGTLKSEFEHDFRTPTANRKERIRRLLERLPREKKRTRPTLE